MSLLVYWRFTQVQLPLVVLPTQLLLVPVVASLHSPVVFNQLSRTTENQLTVVSQ
jgi:hypothetical protein